MFQPNRNNHKILYEVESNYNYIQVVENPPIRKMFFGREGLCHEQSAIDINDDLFHIYDYSLLIMHSVLFVQDPLDVLVVGLGGGIVARQFACYFPNSFIDIVEIDPEVVNVAKAYFRFEESDKVKVHVGDAFAVLSVLNKKYDIIVLDAFTSRYVPFHLMSKEFFCHVLNLSKEKSVVVSNLSHVHPSYFSHVNTIRNVLGEDIYHMSGARNEFTDVVYSVSGNLTPINPSHIRCHFLAFQPEKMVITDEIKSAKIFSILSP